MMLVRYLGEYHLVNILDTCFVSSNA
jgi:hypothetical protein